MFVAFTIRYRRRLLASLLLPLPWILFALVHLESNTTDMAQWVSEADAQMRDYDWFVDTFGIDDFVVASWPNGTVSNPQIRKLQEQLAQRIRQQPPELRLARQVTSGPALVEEVMQYASISRSEAVERLRGLVVGRQDLSCVLIAISRYGRDHPAQVVDFVVQCCQACGIPPDQLRLGGSVYQVTSIDSASMNSMRGLFLPSAVLAFVVSVICLRSVALASICMVLGGYAAALSLAILFYAGNSMNGVLIVLPTLVYVLTVSGAVHMINYYVDARSRLQRLPAIVEAYRVGWKPCALASITTSIGLLSLTISDLKPVREFGTFSALGLLASLGLLLLYLPVLLACFSSRILPSRPARSKHAADVSRCLCDFVVRNANTVSVVSIALLVLCACGAGRIQPDIGLDRMFHANHRLLTDYRWLENNLAKLAAIEVVAKFDQSTDLLGQLRHIEELQQRLKSVEAIVAVQSAATYLPAVPTESGLRNVIRRTVMKKKLEQDSLQLVRSGWLARAGNDLLWRVTARVSMLEVDDYQQVTADIRQQLADWPASKAAGFSMQTTGSYPVLYAAQRTLFDDLFKSFLTAFAIIFPVLALVLRSVAAAALAMIPNVAPVVFVFGLMGWLEIPLDIGTMLTASVALGIAVDDTIHFLTWYRRSNRCGTSVKLAIENAYARCAKAMVQTTAICGLGILVFSAASFAPASRFALLLCLLLLFALVGDLILLPAILASRLGVAFGKPSQRLRLG